MYESKLIRYYKTFNKKDLVKLEDYLCSPYFNKHKATLSLHKIISKAYPDYESKTLQKESVFKKLFPKEKYKEAKVTDTMSYLFKHIEFFIGLEKYKDDEVAQKTYLANNLLDRRQEKDFSRTIRSIKAELERINLQRQDIYYYKYKIEDLQNTLFSNKGLRQYDPSLQNTVNYLDLFYLKEKLRTTCEIVNRQNIINVKYETRMTDEVMEHVKENYSSYLDNPIILIYYQIVLMITYPENENHFRQLIKLLTENALKLNPDEATACYTYPQNYCIRKINDGKSEYMNEIFKIYQERIVNKTIFDGAFISQWNYKNIVTVGTRLKEYDWTQGFIEKYKANLPKDIRENAYNYNLAAFFYEKGDLEKAMTLLQSVEFTDLYYNLSSRTTLLKIYYELNEDDPLFYHLEAFKVFLRRNKLISKYQLAAHLNLVKFTKRLLDLKIKAISARKATIKKDVETYEEKLKPVKTITNLNWIKTQLKAIES